MPNNTKGRPEKDGLSNLGSERGYQLCPEPATQGQRILFALAVDTAIIIVAIPAKKPDIDDTSTNGYPRRTEVNDAEFVKHVPPVLIGMRGAAQAGSNKMHSPALLFAWFTLHKHKYAACYALTKKRMKRRMNTSALW